MKGKMTPKVFFYVMVASLILLILGSGGALYFANNLMQKHSKDVVALKLQNSELDEQVNAYHDAQAELKKYADLQDLVDRVVPTEKDQAAAIREIFALAEDQGFSIQTVTFPSSTLGAAAGATGTSSSTTTTPTKAPPITQAKPVQGLTGVYGIEASIVPLVDKDHVVTYSQLLNFLSKLELNRRTMQITNLQVTPEGIFTSSGISFTLNVNIFVKPDTTPATGAAATKP